VSEPTPEIVHDFFAFMAAKYGARIVDKGSAFEMKLAATVLRQMGVLDADGFLDKFATTIGHRVYLPFTPGEAQAGWSLWSQIMVLTHECQHIVQYDSLGALRFGWQYLGSTAARTRLEAEAYRCQLELHFWRTGRLLSPHDLAGGLRNYAVTDADVQVAETFLGLSAESVKRGAVINPTSRAAIDWLSVNAPELRSGIGWA
jgi:hypothetical protein